MKKEKKDQKAKRRNTNHVIASKALEITIHLSNKILKRKHKSLRSHLSMKLAACCANILLLVCKLARILLLLLLALPLFLFHLRPPALPPKVLLYAPPPRGPRPNNLRRKRS